VPALLQSSKDTRRMLVRSATRGRRPVAEFWYLDLSKESVPNLAALQLKTRLTRADGTGFSMSTSQASSMLATKAGSTRLPR